MVQSYDFMAGSRLESQLDTIRKVLLQNLQKDLVPFPINRKLCSSWTSSLEREGETIIYTSYMYQLAGLFKTYEKLLPKLAGLGGLTKLASVGKFLFKPEDDDMKRSSLILNWIVDMLHGENLEFGYLYEDEPYSGGLLLELGLLEDFSSYGKRLIKFFGERKIRRIITVDPHTTNALTRLVEMHRPEFKVVNYLELVTKASGSGEFAMHDSCLYSRYLGMHDSIREKLSAAGISLKEDRLVTGKGLSLCCGGPLGPVDIGLSDRIAQLRAKQLSAMKVQVLVACPLCYQNLSPYLSGIKDIAEVIA